MHAWMDYKKLHAFTTDGFQLELSDMVSDVFADKAAALEFTRWDQFSLYEYEIPIKYISLSDDKSHIQVALTLSSLESFRKEIFLPLAKENIFFEPAYVEFIDFSMPYLIENKELKFKYDNFIGLEIEFLDKQFGTIEELWLEEDQFIIDFQIAPKSLAYKKNFLLPSSKLETIDWLQRKGFANAKMNELSAVPPTPVNLLKTKFKELIKHLTPN